MAWRGRGLRYRRTSACWRGNAVGLTSILDRGHFYLVRLVAYRNGSVVRRRNEVPLHSPRLVLGVWEMGDRHQASITPWYVTKSAMSTHPCIYPGPLNRVPALIGWGKGGNVTPAGWRASSRIVVRHVCEPLCAIHFTLLTLTCDSAQSVTHPVAGRLEVNAAFRQR